LATKVKQRIARWPSCDELSPGECQPMIISGLNGGSRIVSRAFDYHPVGER